MRKTTLAFVYFGVIAWIVFLAGRAESQFMFAWIRSIPGADKSGHFLLIGGFAFVVNYSLACRQISLRGKKIFLGSAIVALLTVLEEFSQLFIRYRTFDLLDLTFDFLGIWFFGWLAKRFATERASAK